MKRQCRFSIGVLIAAAILGLLTFDLRIGFGQESSTATSPQQDKLAALRQRVTDSELADEQKTPILELIGKAETETTEALTFQQSATEFQASLAALENRVQRVRAELDSLQSFKPEAVDSDKLPELEAALLKRDGELAAAKQSLADADSASTLAPQRRREIESQLLNIDTQLVERRSQMDAAAADTNASLAIDAARLELTASEQLLLAKAQALNNEAALIDAETAASFHQLDRDLKSRLVQTAQEQRDLVERAVEAARAKDAAARVETAEAQLLTLHPALQPIGQRNRELAALNLSIASQIESADTSLQQRIAKLEELRLSFTQAKARVDTIGLSEAVGSLLRSLKQSLPRPSAYLRRSKERQPLINDAQYTLIDLNDQRNASLDVQVMLLLDATLPPIPYAKRSELAEEAKALLSAQRSEFLDPVIRNQRAYFNTLVSLSATEQQIDQLVKEATSYVNDRVLWIRSTKPLMSQWMPASEERWIMLPTVWDKVFSGVLEDIKAKPLLWGAALLALAGLIRFRWRLRSEIGEIGKHVTKSTHTAFTPTLHSLALTIATAAPLPLIFGFLAWRFSEIAGGDRALLALAAAAKMFAILYFPLELFRQVCRTDGLAVSHFGWPASSCRRLRAWLRPILLTLIPILVVASFLRGGQTSPGFDTLERYFFIVAMGLLAFFLTRLLHPREGLPGNHLRAHADGWANRLSYLWYPLLIALPLTLGVLAILGYYFTSQQLAWRMFVTLCLVLAIILLGAIVSRWTLLHRRRLRIEQVRREREAPTPTKVTDEMSIEPKEPTSEELRTQMQQTQRLVKTVMFAFALVGMWIIWSDVLTSGGASDEWSVWQSTTTVTETVTSKTGEPVTSTRDVIEMITVADIIMALVVLIVMFLAVRNVPGLLEFAVLQRLPLDNSIRYAITTLASYAIAFLGLIIAGQTIGLHWNQIQWMATALTFGLAFGLQEVFANFVAGIIILFEQPVRVGDVVEIDGITGAVSKIRIRATTITDWNRRDYIVPNKEFITGKVLNWTRSDDVNRAVINVGVAYGTDTDRARELLLQVAHQHHEVLDDPGPVATFEGFGDNSLNFVLRAFIGNLSVRLATIHDLHTEINKTFDKEGIEISFPQRDLHLRSIAQPILNTLKRA